MALIPHAAGTLVVPAARPIATPQDEQLLQLWLHGRSIHTQDAYRRDIGRFLVFTAKPLAHITLGDIQAFADTLQDYAPSSRKRTLSAIKSLYSFAQKIGYLQVNVGAAVMLPKDKDRLGERILSEAQVQRLLQADPDPRNALLLRMLYATGGRVSEVCRLCWRDFQRQRDGWQVTLYGKGGKTRHVLLSKDTAMEVLSLRGDVQPDTPIFQAQHTGTALSRSQVMRIVQAAAKRAGIAGDVSPHWLRHAHISHALDRGAPPHLVQQTVGHASLATTSKYAHARPTDSSARYLAV